MYVAVSYSPKAGRFAVKMMSGEWKGQVYSYEDEVYLERPHFVDGTRPDIRGRWMESKEVWDQAVERGRKPEPLIPRPKGSKAAAFTTKCPNGETMVAKNAMLVKLSLDPDTGHPIMEMLESALVPVLMAVASAVPVLNQLIRYASAA